MIKNLTPHTVTIVDANGHVVRTIESSGVARASQQDTATGTLDGIELVEIVFGAVEGLPDVEPETYLIVSAITARAAAASGRSTDDLLLTAGAVRNADGQIIGCRALSRVSGTPA